MGKTLDSKKIETINELGRNLSDATIFLHEAIAERVGLSPADHKYLNVVMQHGRMTAGQLAESAGLTTGAVTGLIDRLEKKKLLKREFDKDDRRKVYLAPQYENIGKLMGPVFGELQKRVVKVLSGFNEKEREVIERYLVESIQMLNEMREVIKTGKGI